LGIRYKLPPLFPSGTLQQRRIVRNEGGWQEEGDGEREEGEGRRCNNKGVLRGCALAMVNMSDRIRMPVRILRCGRRPAVGVPGPTTPDARACVKVAERPTLESCPLTWLARALLTLPRLTTWPRACAERLLGPATRPGHLLLRSLQGVERGAAGSASAFAQAFLLDNMQRSVMQEPLLARLDLPSASEHQIMFPPAGRLPTGPACSWADWRGC
jgi:hypothetical protein